MEELSARPAMSHFVTDTHGLIWYLEDSPRLGREASRIFDACDQGECLIYVPTICLVEVVYLAEKGKIPRTMNAQLMKALREGDVGLVPMPLTLEIVNMLPRIERDIVPDMPDRIIAATALFLDAPLLTRDQRIQMAAITTVW